MPLTYHPLLLVSYTITWDDPLVVWVIEATGSFCKKYRNYTGIYRDSSDGFLDVFPVVSITEEQDPPVLIEEILLREHKKLWWSSMSLQQKNSRLSELDQRAFRWFIEPAVPNELMQEIQQQLVLGEI
jgi:hypothetical protein